MNNNESYLCVKELSNKFRISEITIYRLIAAKQIPASKIGGQWRIDPDLLDKYVKTRSNSNHFYLS